MTGTNDTLSERIASNPRPAAVWALAGVVLIAPEFGALLQFLTSLLVDGIEAIPVGLSPGPLVTVRDFAASIPTLLSRETIPNGGYFNGSRYVGTFMGLSPYRAWLLRVILIYAYSFLFLGWLWSGYQRYREHYRVADWTPRDDVIDRLRGHYWGLFGLFVVFVFIVMAVFAPAMGPTTVQKNIRDPFSHEMKYWDASSGEVKTIRVGKVNRKTRSVGTPKDNVGPMSYDNYGRFHPFGTLPSGKDLFTFIAAGSRVSLVIGLFSVVLSSVIATVFAMLSAYYKGKTDLALVLASDSVMAMPQLLLLIMLSVLLANTWIGNIYSGGFVLGLIFAGTGWPYLWRSVRGPALQVSERQWVKAARSFGQSPPTIMRKHLLPYVLGYLLIYGSMTLGGAIIAISGLSFLGLGVNPPTPEWGRAINAGFGYVDTRSWHISLIPGVLITILVTGFNALGDGIRDAIDPQSEAGGSAETVGRGGGA